MTTTELTCEFENYSGQLKSFLLRFTASVQDTEDLLQETYIKAFQKLDSFKGESSLKTWLFAIASNLARDNQRAKHRWVENVTDIAKAAAHANPGFFEEAFSIVQSSPQADFEIREHIAFCFTCIAKSLPLEQQIALLLKEVYEFKIAEIAQIIEASEAMVKYHLHAARTKMITVFDDRCALVSKRGICHQCSELNGVYNPKQQFQEEAVKIAMVRDAGDADKSHLFELRMQVLKELDPFKSGAADLQLHHLEHNRSVMEKYSN